MMRMKCEHCSNTGLILDEEYKKSSEGAKMSGEIIRSLSEKMQKIEKEPLPESYVVDTQIMAALEAVASGRRI